MQPNADTVSFLSNEMRDLSVAPLKSVLQFGVHMYSKNILCGFDSDGSRVISAV